MMESIKLCQTDHGGVMIPAVGRFADGAGGHRHYCQACLDHKRSKASAHSASARARSKSKPNYSYQVKDVVAPSPPPAWRAYVPQEHPRMKEYRETFACIPSLVRDD